MSKQLCGQDAATRGVGKLATVLSDGLPSKGVGEARCIGAARLLWWPFTSERVGAHLYIGVNLHRDLLQLDVHHSIPLREYEAIAFKHSSRGGWPMRDYEACGLMTWACCGCKAAWI
jgi:hypothetical protein